MESLISIDFSPDDPRIEAYRKREDAVRVTIHLDPRITDDDSVYTMLTGGKVYEDPFGPDNDPFHMENWNLFVDRVDSELWTGFNQSTRNINNTEPLKLLGLMLDCYPGEAAPSQIRECLGKYDYSGDQIKKLYSRLRAIVGPDIILPSTRRLNPDKIIIIKERPRWKPNTTWK